MMWDYFFPEEDDSQRRQVSCKVLFVLCFTGFCLIWSQSEKPAFEELI
jgi:hypothetical protein